MKVFHRRLLACTLTLLLLSLHCEFEGVQSKGMPQIRLSLKLVDRPSSPVPIDGVNQAHLDKSSGVITDQVVLLHCDEDSGDQALDATPYGNHARLYNVKRTDSSATPLLKKALDFQPSNSYALLPSVAELNATLGFEIDFYFYIKEPFSLGEQRLLDRMDAKGGYTIGLIRGHVFLRVRQGGTVSEVMGGTVLTSKKWYQLRAYFGAEKISLTLDGTPEAEKAITGTLASSSRQTLLGCGWSESGITSFFWGRMDEIRITATVEYESFDAIRVLVFDLSNYSSREEFSYSEDHTRYHIAFDKMLSDTTKTPSWTIWKTLLTDWLHLASESVLTVRNGFAEGTIYGVTGLNYIAVGAIQKNELTYLGYTALELWNDRSVTDVEIEIWKAR